MYYFVAEHTIVMLDSDKDPSVVEVVVMDTNSGGHVATYFSVDELLALRDALNERYPVKHVQWWEPVMNYRIKCACENCAPLSTSPLTTGPTAYYMDVFESPNNPGKTGAFIYDGKSDTHIVFPKDCVPCRLVEGDSNG